MLLKRNVVRIRLQVGYLDLTKVVMGWRRLGLAKERLVPLETARNIMYADNRPCTFHRVSTLELAPPR